MGVQIDKMVNNESEMEFHIINTNAQHLNDDGTKIYQAGKVVTYGYEKFEGKLKILIQLMESSPMLARGKWIIQGDSKRLASLAPHTTEFQLKAMQGFTQTTVMNMSITSPLLG